MQIKPISEIRVFMENYAAPMGIEVVDVEWNDKSEIGRASCRERV